MTIRKTSLQRGDEFHHIVNVSRTGMKYNNGMEQLAHCEITLLARKHHCIDK